jgi:hypothetical protein
MNSRKTTTTEQTPLFSGTPGQDQPASNGEDRAASAPPAAEPDTVAAKSPSDADDLADLWEDDALGDPLAADHVHHIPVDPPRDFFRSCPDRKYRRKTWVYVHKSENAVGKQYFIVQKAMRDKIPEARPCTLLTVVDRAGMPGLWPLMSPRPGESDNTAWATSRDVARDGLTRWTKPVWQGRQFISRFADQGYAPDPDWRRLPPFNELVRTGLGPDGIIRDEQNRAYRAMFGKVDQPGDLDADEIDDEDGGDAGPEDALH